MKTDSYLIKAPPGMMALWKQEAARRGISLAQLIRTAVNREIERTTVPSDPRLTLHD